MWRWGRWQRDQSLCESPQSNPREVGPGMTCRPRAPWLKGPPTQNYFGDLKHQNSLEKPYDNYLLYSHSYVILWFFLMEEKYPRQFLSSCAKSNMLPHPIICSPIKDTEHRRFPLVSHSFPPVCPFLVGRSDYATDSWPLSDVTWCLRQQVAS